MLVVDVRCCCCSLLIQQAACFCQCRNAWLLSVVPRSGMCIEWLASRRFIRITWTWSTAWETWKLSKASFNEYVFLLCNLAVFWGASSRLRMHCVVINYIYCNHYVCSELRRSPQWPHAAHFYSKQNTFGCCRRCTNIPMSHAIYPYHISLVLLCSNYLSGYLSVYNISVHMCVQCNCINSCVYMWVNMCVYRHDTTYTPAN